MLLVHNCISIYIKVQTQEKVIYRVLNQNNGELEWGGEKRHE